MTSLRGRGDRNKSVEVGARRRAGVAFSGGRYSRGADLTLETSVGEALEKGEVLVPAIPVTTCPIAASLEVLGKKWTLGTRDME
jgi:hypothetical protein